MKPVKKIMTDERYILWGFGRLWRPSGIRNSHSCPGGIQGRTQLRVEPNLMFVTRLFSISFYCFSYSICAAVYLTKDNKRHGSTKKKGFQVEGVWQLLYDWSETWIVLRIQLMHISVIQTDIFFSCRHLTNLSNIITAGSLKQDFLVCCSKGMRDWFKRNPCSEYHVPTKDEE